MKIRKLVLLLLVLTSTLIFSADKKQPIATVTFYLGEVMYKNVSKADWQPIERGMVFYEGDKLKTAADGKAEMFFYTGSKIRIAPDTELEFTDQGKKTKSIFLTAGKIWNKVRKGDVYNIETIHGVASVKGTEFEVENSGDSMSVWVAEGLVQIKNEKGTVAAPKNTKTTMSKDKAPSSRTISKGDMPKWKDKFKAKAVLIVSAPGSKEESKPFKIYATLKNPETKRLYNDEIELKVNSLANGLGFAKSESSSEWNSQLEFNVIGGKAVIWAKALPGRSEFNLTGTGLTGVTLGLNIKGQIKQREAIFTYIGSDKLEHTINLKYKLNK